MIASVKDLLHHPWNRLWQGETVLVLLEVAVTASLVIKQLVLVLVAGRSPSMDCER